MRKKPELPPVFFISTWVTFLAEKILREMTTMKKTLDTNTDIKILLKTYAIILAVVVFVFGGLALKAFIVGLLN